MRPLSLRTALTLVYTGVLAVLTTALAVGFHTTLVRELDRESTRAVQAKGERLLGYLTFPAGVPTLAYNRDDLEEATFVRDATLYFQIYDASDGHLVEQSAGLENLGLRYTREEIADFRQHSGIRDIETEDGRLRLLSAVVSAPDGATFVVQIGDRADRFDRVLATFDRRLLWRIVAGLLFAAALGTWLARKGLAPLLRLSAATQSIGIANLHERLPLRGTHDELDQVATAFNRALARVDASVGEMRQFSAALAHELRTPLAILRGEAELALKGTASNDQLRDTLASQIEEFDRLTHLINQLLTLARAEAGEITMAREAVDLSTLAASMIDDMDAVATARSITLEGEIAAGTSVRGDAGWIRRLLLILLDNAIKYTPEGGRVVVTLAQAASHAELSVRDTGIGIDAETVPRVFERFYRADPARSKDTPGAGLGLALARWISDQHGATIAVTSRLGAGSTFTVTFPVTPA